MRSAACCRALCSAISLCSVQNDIYLGGKACVQIAFRQRKYVKLPLSLCAKYWSNQHHVVDNNGLFLCFVHYSGNPFKILE